MTLMEDVSVSVVPTGTFLSAFLAVTFACLGIVITSRVNFSVY